MKVLAIDPGERCGWATGTIYTHFGPVAVKDAPRLHVDDHDIAYLKDMALGLYHALCVEHKYDLVVYETFVLTARGAKTSVGSSMQTSQFVGMIRLCCWLSGTKLVGQPPAAKSSARRSLTGSHPDAEDVRQRLSKLPGNHDDSHDGDALLHLWSYFFLEHA